MTADILNFARVKRSSPLPALSETRYHCLKCEKDKFLAYPTGELQCAGCGAKIKNLTLREIA